LVKYFKSLILAIVGAAAMTVPTIASPIGFNGAYDYATTWSSSETYGGAVVSNIDPSQQTLTLFDPNSWPNTPVAPQEFDFTHPASASGIVSFHWSFDATADPSCCSGFNFYVNGTLYNLEGGDFANPTKSASAFAQGAVVAQGDFSVAVNAGDLITFGAFSASGCCGKTEIIITNFDAPVSAVPLKPSIWANLIFGFLGLAWMAYRRKNQSALRTA
jgi:hypothetical protein